MKIRILTFVLCVLIVTIIPNVTGICYDLDTDHLNADILMRIQVFGLFPSVSDDEITFLSLPAFRWLTIPKETFEGHIGIFLIFGSYTPS